MSKNKEKQDEPIQIVEQTLTRTEQFIENNQKLLTYIIGGIVILVVAFILFKKYYISGRDAEAQNQMWTAQMYFEKDSLDLALNGDGNYPGFISIANDYWWTKSSNLSHFYIGISYLKQGSFELAIEHLKKFSTKSKIMGAMALGAIGDAYMELNDVNSAVEYYVEASEKNANDFTSPLFLMKAGWAYEEMQDYKNALKMYEIIKVDYYSSTERREIDKYIARVKALM